MLVRDHEARRRDSPERCNTRRDDVFPPRPGNYVRARGRSRHGTRGRIIRVPPWRSSGRIRRRLLWRSLQGPELAGSHGGSDTVTRAHLAPINRIDSKLAASPGFGGRRRCVARAVWSEFSAVVIRPPRGGNSAADLLSARGVRSARHYSLSACAVRLVCFRGPGDFVPYDSARCKTTRLCEAASR